MNVRTPADVMAKSVPDIVNVTACRSVAVTVPTEVAPSSTINVEADVNTGDVVQPHSLFLIINHIHCS